jgi:uncharacterized protein
MVARPSADMPAWCLGVTEIHDVVRPVPVVSAISQPYWDGTRRSELLFQRCRACASIAAPPQALCPHCMSADFEWERSSGRGLVYSHTVVHRQPVAGIDVPFVLALVTLDEDWHILTHVVGCEPDIVRAGMPVVVDFQPLTSAFVLPVFRPDEGAR